MAQSPQFPQFGWVQPKSWTSGRPAGKPLWVVLHYTAGSEGPTSAEDGAAYDARRTDGTSCHFFVDRNSVVQCVRTTDVAHSALYNGNMRGIHIEMCGTVQTRAQWLDEASRPTIRNAALVASMCMKLHGIANQRLTSAQVAGKSATGYCDHAAITAAFPQDKGTHTDVGPDFPWDVFAADLKEFMTGGGGGAMELTTRLDQYRDVGTALREIHAATHSTLNDATTGAAVRIARIDAAVASLTKAVADLSTVVAGKSVPVADTTAIINALRPWLAAAVAEEIARRLSD